MPYSFVHKPVLLDEVVKLLAVKSGATILDGTVGLAGHAQVLADVIGKKGTLLCFDRDKSNLDAAKKNLAEALPTVHCFHASYHQAKEYCESIDVSTVDGILIDLGISSVHVDNAERGFSYRLEGPLDMRFDQTQGQTAAEYLATVAEKELTAVLKEYGELQGAHKYARFLKAEALKGELLTTQALYDLVVHHTHPVRRSKVVKQVFQALRVAVNNELEIVKEGLAVLWDLLAVDGVIAIITFHSVEDRLVKQFFKEKLQACTCPKEFIRCVCDGSPQAEKLVKNVLTATTVEVAENPRARSAKLRAYKRLR